MRLIAALFVLLALCGSAAAQGCGQNNPNCIVPTAPPGTSNNQAASTAFVQQAVGTAVGGIVMASGPVCPPPAGLLTYGFFANNAAAPTNTTINLYDGSACVVTGVLNQSAHTYASTPNGGVIVTTAPASLTPAFTANQQPAGSYASQGPGAFILLNGLNLTNWSVVGGENNVAALGVSVDVTGTASNGTGLAMFGFASRINFHSDAGLTSKSSYEPVIGVTTVLGSPTATNFYAGGLNANAGDVPGITYPSGAQMVPLEVDLVSNNAGLMGRAAIKVVVVEQCPTVVRPALCPSYQASGTNSFDAIMYVQAAPNSTGTSQGSGYKNGIVFDNTFGAVVSASNGCAICFIGGLSAPVGIDISGWGFESGGSQANGIAFRTVGFAVNGFGQVYANSQQVGGINNPVPTYFNENPPGNGYFQSNATGNCVTHYQLFPGYGFGTSSGQLNICSAGGVQFFVNASAIGGTPPLAITSAGVVLVNGNPISGGTSGGSIVLNNNNQLQFKNAAGNYTPTTAGGDLFKGTTNTITFRNFDTVSGTIGAGYQWLATSSNTNVLDYNQTTIGAWTATANLAVTGKVGIGIANFIDPLQVHVGTQLDFIVRANGIAVEIAAANDGVSAYAPLMVSGTMLAFDSSGTGVGDYGLTAAGLWTWSRPVQILTAGTTNATLDFYAPTGQFDEIVMAVNSVNTGIVYADASQMIIGTVGTLPLKFYYNNGTVGDYSSTSANVWSFQPATLGSYAMQISSGVGAGTAAAIHLNLTNTLNSFGLLFGFDGPSVTASSYHQPNGGYIINDKAGPLIFGANNTPEADYGWTVAGAWTFTGTNFAPQVGIIGINTGGVVSEWIVNYGTPSTAGTTTTLSLRLGGLTNGNFNLLAVGGATPVAQITSAAALTGGLAVTSGAGPISISSAAQVVLNAATGQQVQVQVNGVLEAAFYGGTNLTLGVASAPNVVCSAGGTAGVISTQVSATGCAASSERFKRDLQPIDPEAALKDVVAFKPIYYRYKPEMGFGNDVHAGFTAEQIEKVDKQWITYEDDDKTPHAVKYNEMAPLLVGAIQSIVGACKGVKSDFCIELRSRLGGK